MQPRVKAARSARLAYARSVRPYAAVTHARMPCLAVAILALGMVAGCESSGPETTVGVGGACGSVAACAPDADLTQTDNASCQPLVDDYVPGSATDGWDACISDDGLYHPFDPNISSVARVGAFEEIATLLGFGQSKVPCPQDFLDARVAYSTAEGVESRVSRREDEHYPAAPAACNAMTPAELAQYPERCVGPAQIQPLLNEAFQQGIDGIDPVRNAARIEAGLLWFFYLSSYKEAITCTTTPADCDSCYAYYTGGEPETAGLGLSRYLRDRSAQAHGRVWDGILAVRCWRDLDNPTGAATNPALRDLATAQLDRALLRGVALIVRQRVQTLPCDQAWETVQILAKVLDREAEARDPTVAAVLRTELAAPNGQAGVTVSAVVDALDSLFPCP
jgi:hypothetical protein